jgi:hypothetical protein
MQSDGSYYHAIATSPKFFDDEEIVEKKRMKRMFGLKYGGEGKGFGRPRTR